jgi:plastocyanin
MLHMLFVRNMKHVGIVLIAALGAACVATAGNIEGSIRGWSTPLQVPSNRPAVVWLEGVDATAPGKSQMVMSQHGGQFVPPFLVVVAGQTVEMPNDDEVAHNVYSLSPAKLFNLGYYAKGERKAVTFDRPGLIEVLCVIHTFMRGKILVVPNRFYSKIRADGSFRIANVPPGRYTVTFWADGLASFSQQVIVPSGEKPVALIMFAPDTALQK